MAPAGDAHALAGRVVLLGIGAEAIVPLDLGGARVLGRVAPDARCAPGSRARFGLDTRKIHRFDPATEHLIP